MTSRGRDVPPGTSEAVTRGIRVSVDAEYAPQHSQPWQQKWFFLYTVRISNESRTRVQLVSRHWFITDASGLVEEVQGTGVIGQQPVIDPGEAFEYTAGCPLDTPFGSMRGTYEMVAPDGEHFDIEIAMFYLDAPFTVH
jgi:ApaG protein